jgi:hypothetical protein
MNSSWIVRLNTWDAGGEAALLWFGNEFHAHQNVRAVRGLIEKWQWRAALLDRLPLLVCDKNHPSSLHCMCIRIEMHQERAPPEGSARLLNLRREAQAPVQTTTR